MYSLLKSCSYFLALGFDLEEPTIEFLTIIGEHIPFLATYLSEVWQCLLLFLSNPRRKDLVFQKNCLIEKWNWVLLRDYQLLWHLKFSEHFTSKYFAGSNAKHSETAIEIISRTTNHRIHCNLCFLRRVLAFIILILLFVYRWNFVALALCCWAARWPERVRIDYRHLASCGGWTDTKL